MKTLFIIAALSLLALLSSTNSFKITTHSHLSYTRTLGSRRRFEVSSITPSSSSLNSLNKAYSSSTSSSPSWSLQLNRSSKSKSWVRNGGVATAMATLVANLNTVKESIEPASAFASSFSSLAALPLRPSSLTSASASPSSSLSLSLTPHVLGTFHLLPTNAEVELIFRLLFASFTGSLIGYERSRSDRPAGIRTMSLVSLGAAAFTVCSMYGFIDKYDTSRMASSVASGVGFIGAGVITNNRNSKPNNQYDQSSSVRGLTTAAAIWVSAAVGVSAGQGMYTMSLVTAGVCMAVLRFGVRENFKRRIGKGKVWDEDLGAAGRSGSGGAE